MDQAASYEVFYPRERTTGGLWEGVRSSRVFGPKDVVPGPRYEIYVRARNSLGTGPYTRIECPTAAPSGADQYPEVKKIAHIGNVSGAYNMAEFLAEKFPSDVNDPVLAPYPYLTWRDDNCSLGPLDPARGLIQAVVGFGDEYDPPLSALGVLGGPIALLISLGVDVVVPNAPFKHGCWRHDFAWRNLSRIEQNFPLVDSWNETNYRVTNFRLNADWDHACNTTYTGRYNAIGPFCRNTAALALDVMKRATSVASYSSNRNDTGYFVR